MHAHHETPEGLLGGAGLIVPLATVHVLIIATWYCAFVRGKALMRCTPCSPGVDMHGASKPFALGLGFMFRFNLVPKPKPDILRRPGGACEGAGELGAGGGGARGAL